MRKVLQYYRLLGIGVLLSVIAIPQVVWVIMTYINLDGYYENTPYVNWPDWSCIIVMVFCFYSFVRQAVVFDSVRREAYLAKNPATLKERAAFLFNDKVFWIRSALFLAVYALLPLDYTFKSLADQAKGHHLLAKAVLLAAFFFLALLAHRSAYRYWYNNPRPEKYDKKQYGTSGCLMWAVYVCGAFFLALVVPYVIILLPLLGEALSAGLLILLVCLFLFPPAFRTVRAFLKRRSLLKRLKAVCAENGVALSRIKAPYLSLFRMNDGENFRISLGGREYSCKLICGIKRRVPIVIRKDGVLSFLHDFRIRGDITFYEWEERYDCNYESDLPKILIVNPTPKKLLTVREPNLVEIDNGFTVGEFKVFAASGFLRAIEMDTLHR